MTGTMDGIEFHGSLQGSAAEILTPDAIAFIANLQRQFGARRSGLLASRVTRQQRLDAGERPGFLPGLPRYAMDWSCAARSTSAMRYGEPSPSRMPQVIET